MSVVNEAVEDGVGISRVADEGVPFVDRDLTGEDGRATPIAFLKDRYGRRSTLVTSQVPVADWHALIGHATYADAILDRLVHNAHRIELSGVSLRRAKPVPHT